MTTISSTTLLHLILDKLQGWEQTSQSKLKPFVLFDIDGTVLQNSPRQLEILRQILIPTFASLQNKAQVDALLTSPFHKYSILSELHKHLPFSHESVTIKEEFNTHFLSNRFLHHDIFLPGVKQFIHSLLQNRINIRFITGRPELFMKEGTVQSLKSILPGDFDFHAFLYMKPSPEIKDFEFKEHFLSTNIFDFSSQMLAYIDNETPICHFVKKSFPNSIIAHFDSPQTSSETFFGYTLDSWT
ncbi:MAG: HAD family hydrolase [Promethearchaeota archaeon]